MIFNYSFEDLCRGLRSPRLALGELYELGTKANVNYYQHTQQSNGINVMSEDWDNLVVLDGCRYDLYSQTSSIDGNLRSVTSRGSESWEFMEGNFVGRELHDTVYITSNPHTYKLEEGIFHAIVDLLDDSWDDELRTVPPTAVVEASKHAYERYPNKRLLIHFMQPHFPFIGPTGREIVHKGIEMHREKSERGEARGIWQQLQYGHLNRKTIYEAYHENLLIVLDAVTELLDSLDGRTVITSDHGNLLGDWIGPVPTRAFGHPRYLHVPQLVTVPWHTVTDDSRRRITRSCPAEDDQLAMNSSEVHNRLRNLGYSE